MGELIIIEESILEKLKYMKDFSHRANIILKHVFYNDNIFKNCVYSNLLSISQNNLLKTLINE